MYVMAGMNQIRQIKQQAFEFVAKQNMTIPEYFWKNIRHNQELQDKVDAKFAELIVSECITLMDEKIEEFDDLAAAGDDEFIARSVGAYQIKELIEDHFGVK